MVASCSRATGDFVLPLVTHSQSTPSRGSSRTSLLTWLETAAQSSAHVTRTTVEARPADLQAQADWAGQQAQLTDLSVPGHGG